MLHDGHGVAVGLVFQAYLMVGVGGDSLLVPAPDPEEVGFWEISGHGEQAISLITGSPNTAPPLDPRPAPPPTAHTETQDGDIRSADSRTSPAVA